MLSFKVSVITPTGEQFEYREVAYHSADCLINAVTRFGICPQMRVVPA